MSSTPGRGFSFKLNKKKEKFAPPVASRSNRDESAEFIIAIDQKKIESTKPKTDKGPLVIPLIQNNNWRQQAKERKDSMKIKIKKETVEHDDDTVIRQEVRVKEEPGVKKEEVLSLEEKAQQELLNEAREFNENFEERNRQASKKVIPLLMMNKVPNGFEEDDNFDVSARPDNPTMDDYSKVPVEEYGMALLRGMGFKPEENKAIEPIEVKIRPKGLGLGAEIPKPAASGPVLSKNAEKLEFKLGAHVLILAQEYKDFYGIVEGFDDDMYRAQVRLAINNLSVHVPIFTLQLVSKEEFKKESKVLNRSSYSKYKKEPHSDNEKNGRKESQHKSHSSKEKSSKKPSSSSSRQEPSIYTSIHPGIRVRIIDKDYKRGKYYEKKVTIQDVLTPETCNCVTDQGEKLDEVRVGMLETVVPREKGSKVMILKGEYKREIGKLIERDRDEQKVTVQLISDPLVVGRFDFDDVCEFVRSE